MIVAMAGSFAVFALNAVSILAVLGVLFFWKRSGTSHTLPPEHFLGALRAGVRYARHAPALRLVLTSLNVAAQMASPGWVKARALAVYLLVVQGAMTSGSLLWGSVASRTDIGTALTLAAIGQVTALVLGLIWRLLSNNGVDLATSQNWAEPIFGIPAADDRGPVAVEIE